MPTLLGTVVKLWGRRTSWIGFHLRRALLRGTGGDVLLSNEVYRLCVVGNIAEADRLLMKAQALNSLVHGRMES